MKLYMKQKVFSFKDRFSIFDENGNDKYYVEGKLLSIGKKLHLYDMANIELAFIRQKIVAFMPKFAVEANGKEIAEIVKKIAIKPKYEIRGLGWTVEGDFFAHEYVIKQGEMVLASMSKAWMSWGDSYELLINQGVDEVIVLAVMLAIDASMESNSD